MKCMKTVLYLTYTIFLLLSCVLMGSGVWLHLVRSGWSNISDFNYMIIANVAIASGAFSVIVTFLGSCGTLTNNKAMLVTFFMGVSFLFVLEFGTTIVAYLWREQVISELLEQIQLKIPKSYYSEPQVQISMNAAQKDFQCCGVLNITDWSIVALDDKKESVAKVDQSCCKTQDYAGYSNNCTTVDYIGLEEYIERYYVKGCFDSIKSLIESNLLVGGTALLAATIVHLLGLVITWSFYRKIQKHAREQSDLS